MNLSGNVRAFSVDMLSGDLLGRCGWKILDVNVGEGRREILS